MGIPEGCGACVYRYNGDDEYPCTNCLYNRGGEDMRVPDGMRVPDEKHDVVNHPRHYCRDSAMECIEEMKLVFGKIAVMNFCVCNAWKYRYRSADKNGAEDIAKSDWYIKKYKELRDEK